MSEEINRRLTDQLCELLFVTSPEAIGYLANEGIAPDGVHFTGNTMIGTLVTCLDRLDAEAVRTAHGLPERYLVATLRRPFNIDSLVRGAAAAITDSARVQEETTFLRVPCLTLRPVTERPVTVTSGSNRLVRADELASAVQDALARGRTPGNYRRCGTARPAPDRPHHYQLAGYPILRISARPPDQSRPPGGLVRQA